MLCFYSNDSLIAQCTNGNQPECTCETAPVLCTVDELDNYVFSMASFMHPQDGPTPICQSEPSSQTNNPTWFAFTAWCTNLTLRARPSNCQQVQNAVGVQIAIYEDCTFQHEVACDVDIQDCNTGTKVLTMTGLTIGKVYYFMVDGCLGSYCTVTIDVVGVCGEEVIAPWTMPVSGETHPCAGDLETYTVQSLSGAAIYHWFLDGVLLNQSPSASFTTAWTTPGSYQLCIDASHDPCVPISDDPLPLCVTIEVHEADAGVLSLPLSPLCLNEIAAISSTGYHAGPQNEQMLLVTDAAGIIVDVIPSASGFFTSSATGTFTIYAYNFISSAGTVPAVGSNINDINCGATCCDLISQSITFQGIQAVVSNIQCDNGGTDDDPADDIFTFDLLVTGQTPGTAWRSTDGTLQGTYGSVLNCGPYLIAGGWLHFDLHDYDIPTCFTPISVVPPSPCSVCLQAVDAGTGSTINCLNPTATLTGTVSEAGVYTWTGPGNFLATTLTTVVSDSGWYYLSVDFANQCTITDSVFIDLDTDAPLVDAGPGDTINCLQAIATLTGTSQGVGVYAWTGPESFFADQLITTTSDSGWYYLHADFLNQCTSMDSVYIDMDTSLPEADAGPDQVIDCLDPEVLLDGTGSTGQYLNYAWINETGILVSTQSVFSTAVSGTYFLQVMNVINGCVSADVAVVTSEVNILQLTSADVLDEHCFGEANGMITVTGLTGGEPPYTYTLNDLVTNATGQFTDLAPGEYSLHMADAEGCSMDTFFTVLPGVDLRLTLVPFMELVVGQQGSIEAMVNVAADQLSAVQWNPPGILTCDTCLITSVDALGNYIFQLTVIHQNGCSATAEINVVVVPKTEIYIPNVFSPNGDGINDYFTLYANERVDRILELTIYDRWGELIFYGKQLDPNDESTGWDGRFRGKAMMPSTFVYFFKVLLADGSVQTLSGDLTLLR